MRFERKVYAFPPSTAAELVLRLKKQIFAEKLTFGNILDTGRVCAHAHICVWKAIRKAPNYGPKRVLAASHPSDFYNFH